MLQEQRKTRREIPPRLPSLLILQAPPEFQGGGEVRAASLPRLEAAVIHTGSFRPRTGSLLQAEAVATSHLQRLRVHCPLYTTECRRHPATEPASLGLPAPPGIRRRGGREARGPGARLLSGLPGLHKPAPRPLSQSPEPFALPAPPAPRPLDRLSPLAPLLGASLPHVTSHRKGCPY